MRPVSRLRNSQNVPSRPTISFHTGPAKSLLRVCCDERLLLHIPRPSGYCQTLPRPRQLSIQTCLVRHFSDLKKSELTPLNPQTSNATSNASATAASAHPMGDVADLENLPSKVASRRSASLKRLQPYMDHFLARIAVATHVVNTYTGTDFSPISQLRDAIVQQESHVDNYHRAVAEAKTVHEQALASQQASQKEVVQLLERKHSWSPEDLERYMALIRSEHENEQQVQTAKDGVRAAEKNLEEARAKLEGLERRQYHEEQVWSDTIRRNSTWVTFGLMGLNVVLLLASLVVIEPWRRKRLVREIKGVLADEKTNSIDSQGAKDVSPIDQIVFQGAVLQADGTKTDADILIGETRSTDKTLEGDKTSRQLLETTRAPNLAWAGWKAYWHDLFSDREVALRRVDLTKATLEGIAAGAASMGLLFVLLRPR